MPRPRVTAVVVTHRSVGTVVQTLDALQSSSAAGLLAGCLLVDNQSDDNTPKIVRRQHPWVEVVEAGKNLGFGRANNLALRQVATPYVLLVNPDAVIEPDALRCLLRFLDGHERAAVAGPVLLGPDGSLQPIEPLPTPGRILRRALGWSQAKDAPLRPDQGRRRVDALCGAVLLVRTAVLRQLGGFDPRFFLYFEETDLCRRAAQRGHEVWVVGDAIASHAGHHSARNVDRPLYHGCIAEHFFSSRFHYLAKHHGLPLAVIVDVLDWALTAARTLARRARRAPALAELRTALAAPRLRRPSLERGG